MDKEYKTEDLILKMLQLPSPCPIKIVITDRLVLLYVGPRDWAWSKEKRSLIGSGTLMSEAHFHKIVCSSGKTEPLDNEKSYKT